MHLKLKQAREYTMKIIVSITCFILCVATLQLSSASERIFFEDCENSSYSKHFLEQNVGAATSDNWAELTSEITRSTIAYAGNYSMSYDPYVTGNPQGRIGEGPMSYGNISNFDLSDFNSRYWYFRWYQRWQTGINWEGSCENKTLYIGYSGMGDFTVTIARNSSNSYHIQGHRGSDREQYMNVWATHSRGSLDDEEWHKIELYINVGTTGDNNGVFTMWVDDIQLASRSNLTYNNTIHSNPIHRLTGWPSNTSGTCSGNGRTWLDNLEIYTLSGPNDIPGEGPPEPPPTCEDIPAGAPGDVTPQDPEFTMEDGKASLRVRWQNPSQSDYQGTMVRYNVCQDCGAESRPMTQSEGIQGCNVEGEPGNQSECTFEISQPGTYWISYFTYDKCGNYSHTAYNSIEVPVESIPIKSWNAEEQAGDTTWSDSTSTWCVRLLVEGTSITQSNNQIFLGFKGRTSGNYNIKKVSIAESDMSGNVGDVVDSTWTKVTFDGNSLGTWATDETAIPAGTEKLSDATYFPIQAEKDYYVTFQLVSPSAYLVAPADYQELYFEGEDHADELDWYLNDHNIRDARLHALSSIYVMSGGGAEEVPPGNPTGLKVINE